MKNIYVSMSLNEQILDSYLLRNFNGFLVRRKTCKVVVFSQKNLTWPVNIFKSFCMNTVTNKNIRIYKAKNEH